MVPGTLESGRLTRRTASACARLATVAVTTDAGLGDSDVAPRLLASGCEGVLHGERAGDRGKNVLC